MPGMRWPRRRRRCCDLRQGNTDAARDTLKRLAQDVTAPDGVRGRANGLLARLGVAPGGNAGG